MCMQTEKVAISKPTIVGEKPKTLSRRAALLALLSIPLADVRVVRAYMPGTGVLRIPLDQWAKLTFSFEGQTKTFTTAELFAIIEGGK